MRCITRPGLKPARADRIYDSGVIAWWPGPQTEVGGVQLGVGGDELLGGLRFARCVLLGDLAPAGERRRALGERRRTGLRPAQEELADRCGMFRTYMSRIESGLANPTLTMLHALAKGLDVDIQELFVQVQTPPPVRVRAAQPVSRGRVQR